MIKPQTVKFLFFDYCDYEYVRGFARRLGQPHKYAGNPTMRPQPPHDYQNVHLYGTVLRDPRDGYFKMWYTTWNDQGSYVLYATSPEGYNWTRPKLDVVPGSNIVMGPAFKPHGPSVLLDLEELDDSKRFKLLMHPAGSPAIQAYYSPDGIHWQQAQPDPVIAAPSDSHIGFYRDPANGLYHCSFRLRGCDRRVWLSESADCLHWTRPVLGIEPDVDDGAQTQFYGMTMTPYGNYVLGWLSVLHTEESDLHYGKVQGSLDVELAYSRDGYCWHRAAREFIPRGAPGSWEAGMVLPSTGPVLLEHKLLFAYSGTPYGHGEHAPTAPECVGAATLRVDGFVSLHAGEEPGELITRQFAVHEPGVYVNADALEGEVRVAICDGITAKPLAGFTFEDCVPLRGSGIAQPVRWAGNPDPGIMVNRPIRLAVQARQAELYSVFMPNGADPSRYWEFREITGCDPMLDIKEH